MKSIYSCDMYGLSLVKPYQVSSYISYNILGSKTNNGFKVPALRLHFDNTQVNCNSKDVTISLLSL